MTTLREEAIEAAAKAISPVTWRAFHPELHGSHPNQDAARRSSMRKAEAAFEAIMDRLKEPSPEMIEAAAWEDGEHTAITVWRLMLSVAKGEEGE